MNTLDARKNKIKILYIGGWGRSGSTILGRILGQADGFFFSGETRFFWKRGLQENWKCGCGQYFCECSNWQEIVKKSGFSVQSVSEMVQQIQDLKAKSLLPSLHVQPDMTGFVDKLNTLYTNLSLISRAHVIVDSSKHPAYAWWLNQAPDLDVYLIHLIRDPRGTANSWKKKELDARGNGTTSMAKYSVIENTRQWLAWNILYEIIQPKFAERYMKFRYEDFMAAPQIILDGIFEFLNESSQELVDENRHIILNANHTVSGNRNRFFIGPTYLQFDEQWRTNLSRMDKLTVGLLSFPLLLKYRYSVLR